MRRELDCVERVQIVIGLRDVPRDVRPVKSHRVEERPFVCPARPILRNRAQCDVGSARHVVIRRRRGWGHGAAAAAAADVAVAWHAARLGHGIHAARLAVCSAATTRVGQRLGAPTEPDIIVSRGLENHVVDSAQWTQTLRSAGGLGWRGDT